jgi:hypothetical protein
VKLKGRLAGANRKGTPEEATEEGLAETKGRKEMKGATVVLLWSLILAGCGEQVGRYQMAPINYSEVWRIDTVTGDITRCLYTRPPGAATCPK